MDKYEKYNDVKAEVTLCVFPYTSSILAVDTRKNPPKMVSLKVDELLHKGFVSDLSTSLMGLLESHSKTLYELASIPPKFEELIKSNLLKHVLHKLGDDGETDDKVVGIMFFTGESLDTESPKILDSLKEMFSEELTESHIGALSDQLKELIELERREQDRSTTALMRDVILGNNDGYVPIWQRD